MSVTPASDLSVVELLGELAQRKVTLALEDGRLTVNGPAAALDPAFRAALKAARDDLVALLSTIPAKVDDVPAALTQAQDALLPLARAFRDDARHHVPLVVELDDQVDLFRLVEAMNIIQDRHDGLRQCFPEGLQGTELRPRAARIGLDATLELDPDAVDQAIGEFVAQPFDLAQGPLWRAMAIRTGPRRVILAWVFHHLVFDGFSREVFLKELAAVDGELGLGLLPLRQASAWQASDVAVWERAQAGPMRIATARKWWAAHLAEGVVAALPPVLEQSGGSGSGGLAFDIPLEVARAMRRQAREAGIPVAAFAIAAVARVLGAVTGQKTILIATPVMNRDHPKAAGTIGYLSRILPLVIPTCEANAEIIGRQLLTANDHRHLPGAELAALVGLPMDRLLVAWQERSQLPALQGRPMRLRHVARVRADFELSVQFESEGEALSCRIDWADGTLGATSAPGFASLLQAALEGRGMPPGPDPQALAEAVRADPAVAAAAAQIDSKTGISTVWLELDEFCQTSSAALMRALSASYHKVLPAVRFVTCAALPRRADGSIDLDRLNAEGAVRGRATTAPETELQGAIAEIWQRILMSDSPIGIDDDFRDIGGHSLLAVRMLAEVMKHCARDRLSVAMASARTIRALAAAITAPEEACGQDGLDPAITAGLRSYTGMWQGSRHSDTALVVGRNGTGTRVPLFWCLQSERELDALASHLGADQPVFGMRSGYQVMVKSPQNIERLAAVYAAEIMEIQPLGPLFVGGNCQAAVIAFSIARHLQAAGRMVDLLVLHEKMVPLVYAGRIALTFGRESDRNPYLAGGDPAAEFARYYSGEMTIGLVAGGHGQFFQEPYVLDLTGTIKQLRDAVPSLRKE